LDFADPSRTVPAVINSFHDSSITGSIDEDAIDSLPSLVSFSANDLPAAFAKKLFPFPRLTLSWFTFG
jgi:hypothetical protein